MKFLVRDDDTCAMTRPDEIEACYRDVWDDVPICLSITPFRIPGRTTGVPEALLGSGGVLPLADNAELVAFLREQIGRGRVDVALHGYHHDRPGGLAEYAGGADLGRKAAEGRAYLEDVLGCPVATFVPPNNTLSAGGFDAVVAAGMNVVNNQTRARLGWRGIGETLAAARYALEGRLGHDARFRVRAFPDYKQAGYETVGPAYEPAPVHAALAECHRRGGVFVLATHYHAFGKPTRSGDSVGEEVHRLIEAARRLEGTEFVRYAELW